MLSLYTFVTPPAPCSYLPDRPARLRYEIVGELSAEEYQERMAAGWRRFGHALFRPTCPGCQACQSIRVPTAGFRPDRSQQRAWAANASDVRRVVGPPAATPAKLALYDAFHAYQHEARSWPLHAPKDEAGYRESFVDNPFAVEEWCYYLGDQLVGVGYVDPVPLGLSAIYFYYDPAHRGRSLGTFNLLSAIRAAAGRGLPYAFLGYYVEGCRPLAYKARFRPNEVLAPAGDWRPFLS